MLYKKTRLAFLMLMLLVKCLWSNPLPKDQLQVVLSIPYTHQYTPNSLIIPFTPVGGLIMVKARVNQVEGNFIFDTGANGLVLNDHYFTPDQLRADAKGMGLSGATSRLGELGVDTLEVDELVFANANAQTIDLRHLENRKRTKILGLIGYEIIKDFEIMFDYKRRFLTFSRTDAQGNILTPLPHTLAKVDSVDFYLGKHIPVIEVTVNKKKKKMGIDTGAEYNLLHIKRSKNIMSNFKILKTIEVAGTGDKVVDALAGKLFRVAVKERYKCAGMSTVLINLKHLERIYQTRLDGILGYEFLAAWLFSINYKKQRLFLHKLEYVRP